MRALLEGKVALITGAGSGIGRAAARLFASEGAAVGVVDVRLDAATEVSTEILADAGRSIAIRADVSSERDAESAVEAVTRAFGGLQLLVNNAGIPPGQPGTAEQLSLERWDEMMNINFRSHLIMCRAAFPWLSRTGGAVVNNASSAAVTSSPRLAHYGTSKTAVVMLSRCLAAEWGPRGIRVNAISPGVIDTGFSRRVGSITAPADPVLQSRQRQHIPLGRLGEAEDVAKVMLFLASDLAGYVSGENIVIDGGLLQMLYPAVNGWVANEPA
jgi:NAD(P)-dependent dehydrogenase (short-subunit alcohol dehydrogenase family)